MKLGELVFGWMFSWAVSSLLLVAISAAGMMPASGPAFLFLGAGTLTGTLISQIFRRD